MAPLSPKKESLEWHPCTASAIYGQRAMTPSKMPTSCSKVLAVKDVQAEWKEEGDPGRVQCLQYVPVPVRLPCAVALAVIITVLPSYSPSLNGIFFLNGYLFHIVWEGALIRKKMLLFILPDNRNAFITLSIKNILNSYGPFTTILIYCKTAKACHMAHIYHIIQ